MVHSGLEDKLTNNRLVVVALCVLATAGLATASCSAKNQASGGSPSVTSSPTPPSAKDVLLSAKSFDQSTYDFQVKQAGVSGSGKMDPVNKAAQVNISGNVAGQSLAMGFILIGSDMWLKEDLGAAANKHFGINKSKWMHVDQSKIKNKAALPVDSSGAASIGTSDMLTGLVSVQRTDDTHFTGTMDVTNANNLLSPDKTVLTRVGDKAKAVPFTATLDGQGRLSDLKVDGTGIDPGLSIETTFSNFGGTATITKPAGAIPAPAGVYTILNG
jgi:hypothetical protein